MIIDSHVAQCHAALAAVFSPFEYIVVQERLVEMLPFLLTHYNYGRFLDNGIIGQVLRGKNAPPHLFRVINI